MIVTSAAPARIVIKNDRRWWTCPDCGKVLGEIKDGIVVVKSGRRTLVILIGDGAAQRCPDPACGAWSMVTKEAR